MRYLGKIQDQKDLITKEYADAKVATTPNILKGDNAGHAVAAEVEEATLIDLDELLDEKANLNGGNIFNGVQQVNDLFYLEGSTPFVLSKQGKIGLRATNAQSENLGQINISNAWYDSDHYGSQMNAKNKVTGKYNALRVSHNGVQYFDEDDQSHDVALVDEIRQVPISTTSDNGKFLRVVNGSAAWETVPTMTGGSY